MLYDVDEFDMHHTKERPDFATKSLSSVISETEPVMLAHKTPFMAATAAVIGRPYACCRAETTCQLILQALASLAHHACQAGDKNMAKVLLIGTTSITSVKHIVYCGNSSSSTAVLLLCPFGMRVSDVRSLQLCYACSSMTALTVVENPLKVLAKIWVQLKP